MFSKSFFTPTRTHHFSRSFSVDAAERRFVFGCDNSNSLEQDFSLGDIRLAVQVAMQTIKDKPKKNKKRVEK